MAEERHPNNGRGWLALIVVVMIMIILLVESNSPLGFLGWFTSVLLAITLVVVIPIGSFLVICAVIRRFAERRQREAEQETEMPEQHQPAPPHSPTRWDDNGC
jgi:flagellar biosynthesis/type III secretory pathway M-ring protein FliF/YscJ